MNFLHVFLAVVCVEGSQEAAKDEFPWAASIQKELKNHFTMGTVVTLKMVIAACHPIKLLEPKFKRLYVMAGSNRVHVGVYENHRWTAQHRETVNWSTHPKCTAPPDSDGPWMYDYAVLKLNKKYREHRNTIVPMPAVVTTLNSLKELQESLGRGNDKNCTAIGWGSTEYIAENKFGNYSDYLMKIQVRLISDMECAYLLCQHFSEFCILLEDEATRRPHVADGRKMKRDRQHSTLKYMFRQYICAQTVDGENGICGGDIGGPLLCDGEIIAITGWNRFCGEKGYPSIHFALIHGSELFKKSFSKWPHVDDLEGPYRYDDINSDSKLGVGSLLVVILVIFSPLQA